MQERALGALIIGGVAIIGVVWAGIEGGIVGGAAKRGESQLESSLYTRVAKYDESVKSLDARVSTCYSREVYGPVWVEAWGEFDEQKHVTAFDKIYGYTDDNRLFMVEIRTVESILDFETKKIHTITPEEAETYENSESFKEALTKSIVANHSASASTFLYGIAKNSESRVISYTVGGEKIVTHTYDDGGNLTVYVRGVEEKLD